MTFVLIKVFIGLGLILFPNMFTSKSHKHRVERLNQLDAGADEAFFEEHRALKAYPAKTNPWIYRAIGVAMLIWALISYLEYLS